MFEVVNLSCKVINRNFKASEKNVFLHRIKIIKYEFTRYN